MFPSMACVRHPDAAQTDLRKQLGEESGRPADVLQRHCRRLCCNTESATVISFSSLRMANQCGTMTTIEAAPAKQPRSAGDGTLSGFHLR